MQLWDNEGEDSLWLLTPSEFSLLPDGTKVESISNELVTKGVNNIDDDTRFGHLAYGIRKSFDPELFLWIKMKS